MKHRLTPAFVANPPVPSKDRVFYWEGRFGLMVTANGHKSYVWCSTAPASSPAAKRCSYLGGPDGVHWRADLVESIRVDGKPRQRYWGYLVGFTEQQIMATARAMCVRRNSFSSASVRWTASTN